MLTRQEIFNTLMDLDFSMLDAGKPIFYGDMNVIILAEGRGMNASSPRGSWHIPATSAVQLEGELTRLLDYQRPINGFF